MIGFITTELPSPGPDGYAPKIRFDPGPVASAAASHGTASKLVGPNPNEVAPLKWNPLAAVAEVFP